jgi:hypothetical protein
VSTEPVAAQNAGVRDEQPEYRFIVDYTIDLTKRQ